MPLSLKPSTIKEKQYSKGKENMIKIVAPVISILAITGLLLYAMHLRIDGLLLAGGVAIIAGLGGYIAPHKLR
ncbi:hypothetical protein ES703_84403 [subsurface metagenome]